MKLRTVLAASFFALATLACGGGTSSMDGDYTFDYTVDLTSPWTEMSLPLDDGKVILSADSSVAINYARPVSEMQEIYTSYVKAQGYSETYSDDSMGTFTAIYEKDGKNLTLVVMESVGQTTVSMTLS
ncbi:MAG: hypothetical protein JXX28_16125 [Deltaproteobacteria bacterium]|nr:hypothetical protein [Deltaproteobacteria bacterium]